MVTPTSSDKTISEISKNAKGFIYYVSSTGVTGSRDTISDKNFENINKIKKLTKIPILIGFGISTKDHINQIKPWANGVIIASALINEINSLFEDNVYSTEKLNKYINKFINNLRDSDD